MTDETKLNHVQTIEVDEETAALLVQTPDGETREVSLTTPKPTPPDLDLDVWQSREQVEAMARRLRYMLPGGERMSLRAAMALAQYSMLVGANPFRGDVYAIVDENQPERFELVDGYKLLVRDALNTCGFTPHYEPIAEGDPEYLEGAVGFRCYVLRNDNPHFATLVNAGVQYMEALRFCAPSAVGIVRPNEMKTHSGREINPPKGWSWQERARTRALKNALRKAYASPSPEARRESAWTVGATETVPSDWYDCEPGMTTEEKEALAKVNAQSRNRQPTQEDPETTLQNGRQVLHGDGTGEI